MKFLLTALPLFVLLLGAFAPDAAAQTFTIDLGGEDGEGGTVTGRVIQLIAVLTILSLAPSILIMMTSFTRIIVVLSFLRTAMGIQQTPPNTVMVSLALFLTFFIMAPTLEAAYEQGLQPLIEESVDEITAFEQGVQPFREFMLLHTREQDLELFTGLSESGPYATPEDIPLQVLIPSFMISELRRAFEIGFMLFLPFLIIDMVTASILMSMGMMMLPPVMISLPFKIIFFVLVDGWYLVAGSLIQSYGPSG
jgi:flagellar biosynthetic protein FliP